MPHPLQLMPGDSVDIIAPASACHKAILPKLAHLLESWQLRVNIPENIFGNHYLCANSDELRFQHLQNALCHSKSKAVWCLLGGYGCAKLMPRLLPLAPPKQQKLFLGFSDITALHLFLQNHWQWSTIHSASARQAATEKVCPESIGRIKNILLGATSSSILQKIKPLNDLAADLRELRAPIIGGNLNLIQNSIGTAWQAQTANKILLLEETNERGYKIDKAFTQLKQAGLFDQVTAILLGDFIGGDEPDGTSLVQAVIEHFAEHTHLPIFSTKQVGHGYINYPVILGSTAHLQRDGEDSHFTLRTSLS